MCACGAEALQGSAGKTGSCFPDETVRADSRNLQYEIRIPLPHFAINPPGWSIGDLMKGSIPSLSVEWHATGGIVDGATLIGAGEAGREAIVPLENRNAMQPFAAAVSDDMQADGTFADMLAVLKQIRDKSTDIYMDSEKIGRALTPTVNRGIGNRAVMSSRGAAYAF